MHIASIGLRGISAKLSEAKSSNAELQVVRCVLVSKQHGAELELEPCPDGEGSVVPTFTPAQFERAIATRATASHLERRQKSLHVRIFHLCTSR